MAYRDARQLLGKASVISLLTLVPLVVMRHVLFVDPKVHLANPGSSPTSSTVTDLDGAARLAYILSGMRFPWSDSVNISAPTGASIWRFETLTQAVQVVTLWIFSKVVDPMLAANLLVFLGWTATGLATYILIREFGTRRHVALIAAVAVQLLPSGRFMAANFTSYSYVAIPLVVIIFARRFVVKPNRKSMLAVLITILVSALFDPYWFYFSLMALLVVSTVAVSRAGFRGMIQVEHRMKLQLLFGSIILFAAARFLVAIVGSSNTGRQLGVATWTDARNSSHSLSSLLTSEYVGFGLPVLMLSAIAGLFALTRYRHDVGYLVVLALLFFSISTRVGLLGHEVVPAAVVRQIVPGVRFFDRASLIAGALFVSIIATVLDRALRDTTSLRIVVAIPVVVLASLPLSYPGDFRVKATKSYHDWEYIRSELANVREPQVLALPFSRRGRDWIEQSSFRVPLVNDFAKVENDPEIVLQASHGPGALAAYLESNGTTHVLAVDSEIRKILTYSFGMPNFIPVGSIRLNGFGEGEDFVAQLYRVRTTPTDVACTNCAVGSYLIPHVVVRGDLVYPPDIIDSKTKWWWIGKGETQVQLQSTRLPRRVSSATRWKLTLSLAPCSSGAKIRIKSPTTSAQASLTPTNRVWEQFVPLDGNEAGQVRLIASGNSCVPVGDNREMLYQVQAVIEK